MKKVLLVGASGYVGRNLGLFLLESCEVCGTYFRHAIDFCHQNVCIDIRNKQDVKSLFSRVRPDVIFHLAYDREDLEDSIVIGTGNLLNERKIWSPSSHFIFLSTDAVFDGESGPYSEDHVPEPIFAYGRAKRKAEIKVLDAGGTVVRTSLVYGFEPPDSRTVVLFRGIDTGKFEYPYFEDEVRCPVFVKDLCFALKEVGERKPGEINILHIAGPEALSRYEFAQRLARLSGRTPDTIPPDTLAKSGITRPMDLSMDSSLARKILKTELRTGAGVYALKQH